MNQKDLDQLISTNKAQELSSILLFGKSRYLSTLYSEKILSLFGGESDLLKMYFDEYDFESAKAFLSQNSLFGDKMILVLKHDKKIAKKEIKELIDSARKNSAMVLYEYYDDISVKKEDYHLQFDFCTRLFQPDDMYSVMPLAKNEAHKNGVTIQDVNLAKIINALNLDMELISNEIRKLSIFNCEISDEIIDSVVLGSENISNEKFFELILSKKSFAQELDFVLDRQGANEVEIILEFERYVYNILLSQMAIKLFGDPKAALPEYQKKLPDKIFRMRELFAKSIRGDKMLKIFDTLLQTEHELKNTTPNSDKKLILLHCLIKIQSFL